MLARGYINGEEFSFFRIVDNVEAAIGEIETFYRNFHSYRFVKRDLVIRLNHPPAPGLVERLNQNFGDILSGGEISETPALPDESNDPGTLDLHRLRVPFSRERFARLRQMIDMINGVD
jgi:hypothetical protein